MSRHTATTHCGGHWPQYLVFVYTYGHVGFLIFLRRVIIDHLEHNFDRILFPIKRRLERNVRPKYDIYICMVFRSHIFYHLFFKQSSARNVFQTEPVRGESVCLKMGIGCIPNGTLKNYPAYMPHIYL